MRDAACVFCRIIDGEMRAHVVLDDEVCMAFLDARPVFPGHVLVVPKEHHETITDLPAELLSPLFSRVQRVARAVPAALDATGTFVGINNKVSQSVPHLHVHVVPRRPKDGLRGFFWPRTTYASDEQAREIAEAIVAQLT